VREPRPAWALASRRLAVVVVEQSAEPIAAAHRPVPHGCGKRERAPLLQALVWPGLVVAGDILGEDALQVLSWPFTPSDRIFRQSLRENARILLRME